MDLRCVDFFVYLPRLGTCVLACHARSLLLGSARLCNRPAAILFRESRVPVLVRL